MTNYKDIKRIPIVAADVPNLDATKITTGTVNNARITLDAAEIPNLDTAKTTTGTFADARISASSVTQHAATYNDNKLQMNIAMLGFHRATDHSLAKYNLVDQIVDEYVDATGVDAGASTNEILSSGKYTSSVAVASTNYFGDDSDGALTTSGDVTHTVLSKNGSYDGDMLVKDYTDLTISAGHTMTVDQPCRGMMIFVSGDCVINGTLSMKNKGALGNPSSSGGSDSNSVQSAGLQLCFQTASGSTSFTNADTNFNGCGTTARTAIANFGNPSSNGDTVTVVRVGGAGGSGQSGNEGAPGGTIANGTGGGGVGQKWASGGGTGGVGTAGTCFAGGTGGGGCQNGSGSAGTTFGGAGGNRGAGGHNTWVGGGAGNPGGTNAHFGTHSGGTIEAAEGLGGLLYLIVKGDLTIGGSGKISADGGYGSYMSNGSGATYGGAYTSGGGNGGGGRTIVAYGGTLSNSGTISAVSPVAPVASTSQGGAGGAGGTGVSTTIPVIVSSTSYNNLTLQSLDTTSSTANPDYADMVILMEDQAGTATLNTDIKGYISEDSGVTFTEGVLVDEGTWGTNKKILAFHDLDISAQSGSAMCYKITTHNQSVSKITNIHATSIGWR